MLQNHPVRAVAGLWLVVERRHGALAIQPAQEHRHGPRIVAQPMARPRDDPQLGRSVSLGQMAGIGGRDGVVFTAVDHRFDRARYDGQRTTDAFAARMVPRSTSLRMRAATANAAVRPTGSSLWLRSRGPS